MWSTVREFPFMNSREFEVSGLGPVGRRPTSARRRPTPIQWQNGHGGQPPPLPTTFVAANALADSSANAALNSPITVCFIADSPKCFRRRTILQRLRSP